MKNAFFNLIQSAEEMGPLISKVQINASKKGCKELRFMRTEDTILKELTLSVILALKSSPQTRMYLAEKGKVQASKY